MDGHVDLTVDKRVAPVYWATSSRISSSGPHQGDQFMTYKKKKLREFEKAFGSNVKFKDQVVNILLENMKRYLASTIDEILGCLPRKNNSDFQIADFEPPDFWRGFSKCNSKFLQNLEEKAGGVMKRKDHK